MTARKPPPWPVRILIVLGAVVAIPIGGALLLLFWTAALVYGMCALGCEAAMRKLRRGPQPSAHCSFLADAVDAPLSNDEEAAWEAIREHFG